MTLVFAGEATEGYPGGLEGGSREETANNVPGRGIHSPQAAKGRQGVGVYGSNRRDFENRAYRSDIMFLLW